MFGLPLIGCFVLDFSKNSEVELIGFIIGVAFIILPFFIISKVMGDGGVNRNNLDVSNLNNEQRKIMQKYVKSKIRESIKEYQQDTKYREVKQVERDRDIREVCLMRAGYQCEINSEHTSFTTVNGRQYVESHHIIPLKYQDQFNFNLDTVDNLIALCPNCHKAIHYGSRRTKEMLLKQIHNIRPVTEYEKLLSFYK
jgi:5-methylcytosine-specific restriction endonuclease McrA